MKSKKFLILTLVVLIALAAIYVFVRENSSRKYDTENNKSVFYSFGELTSEQLEIMQDSEISEDNIAILANDFIIGFDYLENLTAQNELTGKNTEDAKNMALSQLIVKHSLYYYAIYEGLLIDDATIKKSIEENRKSIKSADNYSDFETFLDGLGMSEDEYWDSQFDLYKLNYVVDEFKIVKKEEFAKKNTETMDKQELNRKFSEYFMDIVEETVSKQNIKLDESLDWTFSREDDYLIALCH